MNRFNYLSDVRPPAFPSLATTIAIDNRIRGPLAALVATVFLTGVVSLVQLSRLHAAQRSYATISGRLAASNDSIQTIETLRARVAAKKRLTAQIVAVRRVGIVRINELAWIGNHLPQNAWLTTLRYENGGYSLEGTADRISAVGAVMLALRDNGSLKVPRLLSLRDDPASGARHVHYTLQLEPGR